MHEHVALQPLGLAKQTDLWTPATPTVFCPYYSTSMATDPQLMIDSPAAGNKMKTFQTLQGTRKHGGTVTVMAEPNTAVRWLDMLTTVAAPTGTGPYSYAGAPDLNTDPNFYTMDLLMGGQVIRYIGVGASKMAVGWQAEKMQFQMTLSAVASFYGREIATIATNTITLKTDYDSDATLGLVAGDLVSVVKADGSSRLDTTVTSITDSVTVVLGASAASFAAGDMLVLRMPTPALSLLTPFLWGKTHFFLAADAATALTNSATVSNQTQFEAGPTLDITHGFSTADGEKRSGSFDPSSLIRTQYDFTLKTKQYLDATDGIKKWNSMAKQAFLMRSYAGSANQYELRLSFNDIRTKTKATPLTAGGVILQEDEFVPTYDLTDAQGFTALVINNVSSI